MLRLNNNMKQFKSEIVKFIPDRIVIKRRYYKHMGKELNLKNPKTFNEKMQWLKINDRNTLYTNLVDKYKVREHIKEKLGEKYLIPLIGVWDNAEEIDFSELPNKFVLKCTHDSGGVIVCKDKSKLDIDMVKKKLNTCLKHNYYYTWREWPYKNVKPRIICEKYMVDESGMDLKDYKLMCFNGEVKCILVCSNRESEHGVNINFYDTNWQLMKCKREDHPPTNVNIEKPNKLEMMIKFAEQLAKEITFLRIDFYLINNEIYFGEITFYPGAGVEKFTPDYYDELFGSWLELST